MTHLERVVQALYQALSGVPNLYVMRLRAFEDTELPASNVLIESEDPAKKDVIGPQDWHVRFSIVHIVNGDAPFAMLEQRRAACHKALMQDETLGGLVWQLNADGFDIEPDPELPIVRLWQKFSLSYRNNNPKDV